MKQEKLWMFVVILSFCSYSAIAQNSKIPQRDEICSIEPEDNGGDILQVFNAPKDGLNHYYLSVGHLGMGDEVVQVLFDPIFELFIPLGETLAETQKTLEMLQALYKEEPGTSLEVLGCLAFGFPNEKRETVKVTYRKTLIFKMLEFSLQREGYIRSTHISKGNFGTMVRGVKFYRKIHKKQP